MIDDGRHLDALPDQLGALRLELGLAPGFEGEVVHALGHPERAVQAAVELDGDAADPARLHEGEQLPLSSREEHVPDLAALLHLDDVAANRLESEHPLVERARGVHVESPQADVRPPFAYHVGRPSRPDSMFYISSAFACATRCGSRRHASDAEPAHRSTLLALYSNHW